MANSLLIAAGFEEVISVLGGLIVLVIWLINQVNEAKKKQAAQQQPQQMALPPQPAGPAAAAAGGAPPAADPLRAQVDDFLRRAGKQPAQLAPPPRKSARREEVVVLLDESVAAPQRQSLSEQLRAKQEAAAARRTPGPATPPRPPREQKPRSTQRAARGPRPQSVAEHVAEHVGVATQSIGKEVASLGERVRKADEQFDVQLHQKFDHELGSLAGRRTETAADQPTAERVTPADQIAALLASPEGVRQAIVLNEILRRPTDRW